MLSGLRPSFLRSSRVCADVGPASSRSKAAVVRGFIGVSPRVANGRVGISNRLPRNDAFVMPCRVPGTRDSTRAPRPLSSPGPWWWSTSRGLRDWNVVGADMSDLMNRLSLSAAHAKSNDRQPAAQTRLEAIDAIDARDARIAELATALRDVLDLSDTRKRRELAEIKEIIAKARSALAAPDPGAESVISKQ